MSSEKVFRFQRPLDARLPGVPNAPGVSGPCMIGPHLPMAQLYINSSKPVNPNAVVHLDGSMTLVCVDDAHQRRDVELVARDVAIDAWPIRRPVFAVMPPNSGIGDTHFLELRRPVEYDGAIPQPTVFILATDFGAGDHAVTDMSTVRLRHLGAVRVGVDYQAPDGSFHIRITAMESDGSAATVSIIAGPATDFGVRLPEPTVTTIPDRVHAWEEAVVRPCRRYPAKTYRFRKTEVQTIQDFTATAIGYSDPSFAWFVNDVRVDPNAFLIVPASHRTFDAGVYAEARIEDFYFQADLDGPKLRLANWADASDVRLSVRIVVSQLGLPDRSATATGDYDNVVIEWDDDYRRDLALCLEAEATDALEGVTATAGHPGGQSAQQITRELLRQLGIGIPDPR
jgi:hypothetical protein